MGGERVPVALVSLARTGVVGRPLDEGDSTVTVHLDQVGDGVVHAPPVLHQHRRCPAQRLLHTDHRQGTEAAAELGEPFGAHVDPEQARPHHQAVQRLVAHELVDGVGLPAETRRVQRPATETDEVATVCTGLVDRAEPLLGDELQQILGEHAYHRAGAAPGPRCG